MQDAGKPFAAYGKQRDATYVRPLDHVLVYMLTSEIVEEAYGMTYVQCVLLPRRHRRTQRTT